MVIAFVVAVVQIIAMWKLLAFGKSEYIADNSNNVEVEKVSE